MASLSHVLGEYSPESPAYEFARNTAADVIAQLRTAQQLCEMGASVDVHVDCGYECSQVLEHQQITCSSSNNLNIMYHEAIADSGAPVTATHRARFGDNADNYDLFLYTEDDILLSAVQVMSYFRHSQRLHAQGLSDEYEIGFFRQEINLTSPTLDMVVWEETTVGPEALDVVLLPPPSAKSGHAPRWYVINNRQTHQACWMALQHKILRIRDERPQFFNSSATALLNIETQASEVFWVLHWKKIIPLVNYPDFGIRHLGNLQSFEVDWRGKTTRPVQHVYSELLQLRAQKAQSFHELESSRSYGINVNRHDRLDRLALSTADPVRCSRCAVVSRIDRLARSTASPLLTLLYRGGHD
ncbi:hypothetical protein JKP88DRAFT_245249 [Tribonema minus]|uniref:Uncharacterized protein n=1 Tax=Tribonema minus TaxID=303371 RepID=A0A835YXK0_9STRA|nr:hypothetical protein JKP88DRAFT_245249 [Tribonema minus]